jgi:hypothetical protein
MMLMCGGSWEQDVMQSYKIELREVQKGACAPSRFPLDAGHGLFLHGHHPEGNP